jgi:hypothetical protein
MCKTSSSLMIAGLALLIGCGGEGNDNGLTPGGSNTDSDGNDLYCYGDVDAGVICSPKGDLWACSSLPNGTKKCLRRTPDNQSGWDCTLKDGKAVCVKNSPNAGGGAGWNCVSDATKTTCTAVGTPGDTNELLPPGGGTWNCTVEEFGIQCTGGTTGGGGSGGSTSGGGSGGSTSGGGSGGSTSGGGSKVFTCSYAMIVFIYGGKTYVIKIDQGSSTCIGSDATSKDDNFSSSCNGKSYDNNNFTLNQNGAPVTAYSGTPDCNALFSISGNQVKVAAGVTVLFAVAHNGSFPNHFAELCPAAGTSELTFPAICGN